jgi:peptidoglycan pentaglycine glycine transferase (the first glycine)
MPEITPAEWDLFLSRHPEAHILQTAAWGELKQAFHWQVLRMQIGDTGAQILFRRLFPGIRLAYIPKGPIGSDWDAILPEIDRVCRKQHCVFLKVEPDSWEEAGNKPSPPPPGFVLSPQSIQPPRTLILDLHGDDQVLLGRMKQKTRYNINLALKKGVVIHPTTDLDIFHSLIELTAQRDRFGAHHLDYYRRAYQLFHPLGQCELFLAEYEQNPLAALMVFTCGKRAWYFYGGSANIHRERMPNYLLQWEAMRWARSQGCTEYDFWGVPNADLDALEAGFTQRSDGLWGVYRFKRGFGGELHRAIGPWDRVYQPLLYQLYHLWQNKRGEA